MKKWKICFSAMLLVVVLGCASCDEEQLQQVDEVAQTAQDVTDVGQQVIESPVGGFIPPEWLFWIVLSGALAEGLAGAWQGWRGSQTKKALGEIVRGGEIFKKEGNEKATDDFKNAQNIAQSLQTTKMVKRIQSQL